MLNTYMIPNGEYEKFMGDKYPNGTIYRIKGTFYCKECPEGSTIGLVFDTNLMSLDVFHEVN